MLQIIIITVALPMLLLFSCRQDSTPSETPAPASPAVKKLATETLMLNGQAYQVELAYKDADRQRGLMYRESLDPNCGMLFIFTRSQVLTFHMQNCLMDIDIVYIRATGQIDSIMTMKAPATGQTTALYSSKSSVMYALELAPGQAAALGLKPGDRIDIPKRVRNIIADR